MTWRFWYVFFRFWGKVGQSKESESDAETEEWRPSNRKWYRTEGNEDKMELTKTEGTHLTTTRLNRFKKYFVTFITYYYMLGWTFRTYCSVVLLIFLIRSWWWLNMPKHVACFILLCMLYTTVLNKLISDAIWSERKKQLKGAYKELTELVTR